MLDIEFDHVFTVTPEGDITDGPQGVYAPEVWHVEGEQSPDDIEGFGGEWKPLTGFTGQYGYRGAVMHASEFVGGGLERHILSNPGTYVLCVVDVLPDDEDEDPEPAGWAVLRHTA